MTAAAKRVDLADVAPAVLTVADAARYVGMSESTLRALHRHGDIDFVYITSRPVVRVADLDALIAAAPTSQATA